MEQRVARAFVVAQVSNLLYRRASGLQVVRNGKSFQIPSQADWNRRYSPAGRENPACQLRKNPGC